MSRALFFCLGVVAFIVEAANGNCIGRVRTVIPYPPPPPQAIPLVPAPIAVPCNNDLSTAVLLAQALNDRNSPSGSCYCGQPACSSCPVYASGNLNVEDIIMKLVNALIYTTTQSSGSGSSGGSGGSGSSGGGNGNLIDLDLLGKNGQLLELLLGGQGVLGVGLGQ